MRICAKGFSPEPPVVPRNWGRKATKNSAIFGLVMLTTKPRRKTFGTTAASSSGAPARRQVVIARKAR